MHIDLTLVEACYLRKIVSDRIDYLNHKSMQYTRFACRGQDVALWEEKKACVHGELMALESVYSELALFISQSVVCSGLLNEFENTQ